MGAYVSLCPEPVQGIMSTYGIGADGGSGHPTGVVVGGVEYSAVKLIGEGGYAYIYEGYNNVTGMRVALKRYVFTDMGQQRSTMEEMEVYKDVCPSDFIVEYIDSEVVSHPGAPMPEMWTILEYCEGPSLQGYINSRLLSGQAFSAREVYEIVDGVVHSIGHLHAKSPPVSHWDIKPDNFLFTQGGRLKLCDFGSASRVFYAPQTADEIATAEAELDARMTLLYRSPETLDLWSKQRIDTKADVWALGVLIYVLIFREMPFEANRMEVMDGTAKAFRPGQAKSCPEEFQPLLDVVMKTMLVKKPSERCDIFGVSEALERITDLPPLSRPRPGFQSAQESRFSATTS